MSSFVWDSRPTLTRLFNLDHVATITKRSETEWECFDGDGDRIGMLATEDLPADFAAHERMRRGRATEVAS